MINSNPEYTIDELREKFGIICLDQQQADRFNVLIKSNIDIPEIDESKLSEGVSIENHEDLIHLMRRLRK